MHSVYFLLLNDGNVYKGVAEDLRRRLDEHRQGKVASTRNKRPFHLIGYEVFALKSDVLRREKFLKTTEGRCLFKRQYKDILNKYIK